MLFLLWGASGSGKSAVMPFIQEMLPDLKVHDFDEIGVPSTADKIWRQRSSESWVQRALLYQDDGYDMLLCGQLAYGELLACPSSPMLSAIRACLLDCGDYERINRIQKREAGTEAASQDMLSWAAWMRMHARDRLWRPDVIVADGFSEMKWDRWLVHDRGDAWSVEIVDSTGEPLRATAERVLNWIKREKERTDV